MSGSPGGLTEIVQVDMAERREGDETTEAIIVGAGIAGSALAHCLGQQRRHVIALERDLSEPDRIVGELLQPGGIETLTALGLGDCVEDIDGQAILGYVVMRGTDSISLTYPESNMGVAFHHGRFVQKLRAAAQRHSQTGFVDLRQGSALHLLEDAATGKIVGVEWRASGSKKNSRIFAPVTIVADGCFSRFRKTVVQGQPEGNSNFVGVILQNTDLPLPNRGHVLLADPSPVLMYPISSNEVRMLIGVPSPLPPIASGELARYLENKVTPQLPESLRPAFVDAVHHQRLRTMPTNRLHPEKFVKEGLIVIGDALNMRHPLTGGGMTVAFGDVRLIAQGLERIPNWNDTAAVAKMYERFHNERYPRAATINVLAQALFEVFSATADPALPDMRDACLNYFKLGGLAVSGPMGLLSGLTESPRTLVTHFFAAALYGAAQQLFPLPFPSKIPRAYALVRAATNLVQPLLEKEGVMPPTPIVKKILSKL